MRKVLAAVVAGLLVAGCGAQAQQADQVQTLEQRIQALEQRQQELEAQLERAEKERSDLVKTVEELKTAQQSAQARQEALEKQVQKWAQDVTASLEKTQKTVAQRPVPNCKDPFTRLGEKLRAFQGTPTIRTVEMLADLAAREYEACMEAASR